MCRRIGIAIAVVRFVGPRVFSRRRTLSKIRVCCQIIISRQYIAERISTVVRNRSFYWAVRIRVVRRRARRTVIRNRHHRVLILRLS